MRKQEPAAGKPAATLPGIVTDLDKQIVARGEAGDTRKAICEAFGVTVGVVQRAEYRCRRDAEGRAVLAECPDSIRGLDIIGELDGTAADALSRHHWHHEGPTPERMSDVAALGRLYVSRMTGIGPKSLASIDRVLDLFGIAWSPIDRMPTPKRPEPEPEPQQTGWDYILEQIGRLRERVDRLERDVAELRGERRDHDDADDDSGDDLERAGNLVCLPGVRLADVVPTDGGAS